MLPDYYRHIERVSSVDEGNVAYMELTTDQDYHNVTLAASANVKLANGTAGAALTNFDQIAEWITVRINNKPVLSQLPVGLIRYINSLNGAIYNELDLLKLKLHGRQDWLIDQHEANNFSWFMNGVFAFRIEVKLRTGITNIKLGGRYTASQFNGIIEPKENRVRYIKQHDFSVGGNSIDVGVSDFPWEGTVRRFHLPANMISGGKFELSKKTYIEFADKTENVEVLRENGLIPHDDWLTFGFDFNQNANDGVAAASIRDAIVKVNTITGGNVRSYIEYTNPIPGF